VKEMSHLEEVILDARAILNWILKRYIGWCEVVLFPAIGFNDDLSCRV
jgi:hypothetical protein